jgi:opacity protein-like surface antigen
MRRVGYLLALSLVFSFAASAQEKVDAYLGYSYVHQSFANGLTTFNLNGGVGQVAVYPTSWFGIVGEIGAYAPGTIAIPSIPESINPSGAQLSYMFGPRIAFRHGRLQPYVQGLFGGYHTSQSLAQVQGAANQNSFAMAIGGGVDLKISHHFAIRLAQVDYFMTRLNNSALSTSSITQNNFRYSGGIIFRF